MTSCFGFVGELLFLKELAEMFYIAVGELEVFGRRDGGVLAIVAIGIIEEHMVAVEVVGDIQFSRIGEHHIG